MAEFKNISSNSKKTLTVSDFGGVDLTNASGKISHSRSPDAVNMIRDSRGKVKKRFGYREVYNFGECVYGIFYYTSGTEKKKVVHAGSKLYIEADEGYNLIYTGINEKISQGIQFSNKLIIADGKKLLYYDGETVGAVEDIAHIPTIVTGRRNSGGGTFYEGVNMLSTKRIEKFCGDGMNLGFQLTVEKFDSIVYIKCNRTGTVWEELNEFYDYRADKNTGQIVLTVAPPESDVDNLEICYIVKNDEYFDIINTSTIMTLYGAYGATDRIFLGGNSVYPNRDYYSDINDPTYFPDTNYGIIGRDESAIVGYSLVSDNLCAHKDNELNGANMILRYGTVDEEGSASFKISGTCIGSGAVSQNGFGNIDNEPAYISKDGVCAITPSDIIGERYSQLRSYYLNGRLLSETDFSKAYVVTHNQFFMVLLNDKIYILDSLKASSEGNNSYSHRQYEGYVWETIPANILFSDGNVLMFGGKEGALCEFYNNEESDECYLDNKKTYEAYWQFSKFLGDDFSKKKTIMHISVLFDDYSQNTKLQYKDGEWKDVLKKNANSMFFSKRLHLKNTKDAEIRIINSENEAMKLNTVKLTYINNGRIK